MTSTPAPTTARITRRDVLGAIATGPVATREAYGTRTVHDRDDRRWPGTYVYAPPAGAKFDVPEGE